MTAGIGNAQSKEKMDGQMNRHFYQNYPGVCQLCDVLVRGIYFLYNKWRQ